jgi:hypothetical protein
MAEQVGDGEAVARGAAGRLVIGDASTTSIMRWQAGHGSITNFPPELCFTSDTTSPVDTDRCRLNHR